MRFYHREEVHLLTQRSSGPESFLTILSWVGKSKILKIAGILMDKEEIKVVACSGSSSISLLHLIYSDYVGFGKFSGFPSDNNSSTCPTDTSNSFHKRNVLFT